VAAHRRGARPSAPARRKAGAHKKKKRPTRAAKGARARPKKPDKPKRPRLAIKQILSWMDEWHARTGKWPTADSGRIPRAGGLTWRTVNQVLVQGRTRRPAGLTLARLRAEKRGVPHCHARPRLTEAMILRWADSYHARTGRWPAKSAGPIAEAPDENWQTVDSALYHGGRGLPGGSSLLRLLASKRGVRNPRDLPRLTIRQILEWADAHHERVGEWPTASSGPIAEAPGESWKGINVALRWGRRRLPGGTSLAGLLAARRGRRISARAPALKENQIVRWADAFRARTGHWPNRKSGPIRESPGDTWLAVENALRQGLRGLPGGSSLIQLLVRRRGIRNQRRPPRLGIRRILDWADAFHERTGHWPTKQSGAVDGVVDESWAAIDSALRYGLRGLRVRSTLAGLLAARRGKRHSQDLPALTRDQILRWADAFHAREGRWPKRHDGKIRRARGESWDTVDLALRTGTRGLSGKSSLALLLSDKRGVRSHLHEPPLAIRQILEWAHAYRKWRGKWPTRDSGAISNAPGETWQAVHLALYRGRRGLPGGTTLAGLLKGQRKR
jgi:hypothetical protein